ncbi:tetratricopeptide repeat protein [Sphingobium sp.]|uniref:tetratricopeptide repeat protein n=1 Tax=Sphingobium sp. TaxID=1912891 RepID=UPI003B3B24BA
MRIDSIFSRLPLTALAAVAVVVATPAVAKKKLVVAGPPITMSDTFRAGVQSAEAALKAGNSTAAATQIATLSPTNDFESYIVAGLKFQLASQKRDIQAQRLALTDLFKTTALPRGDAPRLRYVAAYLSYVVGNYEDAVAQLDYAKTLGYDGVDATMLRADIAMRRNKPKEARPFVQAAIAQQKAAGKPVPLAWTDRAISMAYQAGDWPEVGQLYRDRLNQQEGKPQWRSALINYQSAAELDPQLQLDLYRLQAANGAMASERDYQSYAQAAEKSGYYAEAKAIIEAGRSVGKLTPTQSVTSQLLKSVTPKATKEIAALPAQAKKAAAASTGKDALGVADSYFSLGQYPQAVEQYRLALSKGGVDAGRANARLGVALARSGDLTNAQATLAQVTGNWTAIAGFWTLWAEHQDRKIG